MCPKEYIIGHNANFDKKVQMFFSSDILANNENNENRAITFVRMFGHYQSVLIVLLSKPFVICRLPYISSSFPFLGF